MSLDIETYLSSLNSGGADSSGKFTLDPTQARQRYETLLHQDPALPLLRAIQICVCAAAKSIEIRLQRDGFRLNAQGLTCDPAAAGGRHWQFLQDLLQVFQDRYTLAFQDGALEMVVGCSGQQPGRGWLVQIHTSLCRRCCLCPVEIRLDSRRITSGDPQDLFPQSKRAQALALNWLAENTLLGSEGFLAAPMAVRPARTYQVGEQLHRTDSNLQVKTIYHRLPRRLGRLSSLVRAPKSQDHGLPLLAGVAVTAMAIASGFVNPLGFLIAIPGALYSLYQHHQSQQAQLFLNDSKGAFVFPGHLLKAGAESLHTQTFSWDRREISGWKVAHWVGLPAEPGAPSRLYLYCDGLLLDPVEIAGPALGATVVALAQGGTDMSGLKILEDDLLQHQLREAEEQIQSLWSRVKPFYQTDGAAYQHDIPLWCMWSWRKVES